VPTAKGGSPCSRAPLALISTVKVFCEKGLPNTSWPSTVTGRHPLMRGSLRRPFAHPGLAPADMRSDLSR